MPNKKWKETLAAWKNDQQNYLKDFDKNIEEVKSIHDLKQKDLWNNKFHLSSFSGLINDPNGLIKLKDHYHIFYQWSPFLPIHLNKHWGHFKTKDFIHFHHTGVALKPQEKEERNGCFSGGGLVEDQKNYIYWTGNVKKFQLPDNQRTSFTWVGNYDEKTNKIVNKKVLFEVDKNFYTGHFRDPVPFKKDDFYFLMHGAQTQNRKGALVLYRSEKPDADFQHTGKIKIKPDLGDLGYMWECPNYLAIQNKEVLIFSIQGKKFFENENTNLDTTIALVGQLNIKNQEFNFSKNIQVIDHGFDFYAPQIFNNTKRKIMMGWAGIGESESFATFKSKWAHCLTMLRELKLVNNRIIQTPIKEYKKLRNNTFANIKTFDLNKSRLVEFTATFKGFFSFKISNKKDEEVFFSFKNDLFYANRKKMSVVQGEKLGTQRTREHYQNFKKVNVFIDNSLIEIYANDGEFLFTTKYWLSGDLKIFFSNVVTLHNLKPLEVEWNV